MEWVTIAYATDADGIDYVIGVVAGRDDDDQVRQSRDVTRVSVLRVQTVTGFKSLYA